MKNIQMVYHHIKLHTSQTPRVPISTGRLWDHIKLHISQTRRRAGNPAVRFTTICFSNMPLNFLSSFDIQNYRLLKHIDDFTDLLPCLCTIQNYILLKPFCTMSGFLSACLPYKITYFSNSPCIFQLFSYACLPYKITYFSNL